MNVHTAGHFHVSGTLAVVVGNFQNKLSSQVEKSNFCTKLPLSCMQSVCTSVWVFHLQHHPTSLLMEEIWFNKALWLSVSFCVAEATNSQLRF